MTSNLTAGRLALAGAVSALALAAAPAAAATWTFSGPGTTSLATLGDTTTFDYNVASGSNGYGWHQWTATATAEKTGTYTFDWALDGLHAWYRPYAQLTTFGATTTTLVNAGTWGSFSFSGSELTFDVAAGDTFGFTIRGKNYDGSQLMFGTLSVTDVAPVPLPASALALMLGLGALGVAGRRKAA